MIQIIPQIKINAAKRLKGFIYFIAQGKKAIKARIMRMILIKYVAGYGDLNNMLELNKIYNMDCIEGIKMLPDESVDFILTDPPYNINLIPQRKITKPILNDNYNDSEFINWFTPLIIEIQRVLKPNTFIVMFCGWSTIPLFREILDKYWTLKSMPIWIKNNFGIGYYTRPCYEPCFLYLKGNPKPLENPISDVWKFDKVLNPIHSCEKPIDLFRYIINSFSKNNDIILDPFMGSGTTALACQQLNRKFIGFEIEKDYCNIASERLKQKPLLYNLNEYGAL